MCIKQTHTPDYNGNTTELSPIMSLLQACNRATTSSRRLLVSSNPTFGRALATDSKLSPETSKKDTDIVAPTQPPRDVMVADVISGAPGYLYHLFQRRLVNISTQESFVTVRCGFINQRETPCRAVGVKASAGG